MILYSIIVTLIAGGLIAYEVYKLFYTEDPMANYYKLKKDADILRNNYDKLLKKTIDTKNPGAGGMPGGQSVGSVDEL